MARLFVSDLCQCLFAAGPWRCASAAKVATKPQHRAHGVFISHGEFAGLEQICNNLVPPAWHPFCVHQGKRVSRLAA